MIFLKQSLKEILNKQDGVVNLKIKPNIIIEIVYSFEKIQNEELKMYFIKRIGKKYGEYLKSKYY